MSIGPLTTLLLYVVALMAMAAWSVALLQWPVLVGFRARNRSEWSSHTWFLLGIAPFLAGLSIACLSISSAVLKGLSWIPDHCEAHPHHPHFCSNHMATLLPEGAPFWLILVGGTGVFLYSVLRAGRSIYGMNRLLRQAEVREGQDGFFVVPSQIPAAFAAGVLKPRAYLTSTAVHLLNSRERQIVAAHEQAHVGRRDPLKLTLLRIGGSLFPGYRSIEEGWKTAAEVECDSVSLQSGARPEEVSLTIIKLARAVGSKTDLPALAYAVGTESDLSQRIEKLLSGVQAREQRVGWIPLVLILILISMGLTRAHHVLETVLGHLIK